MANTARLLVATLGLSAAGFVGYVGHEGWSQTAVPPIRGDVPTYGFGTTRGPDGKPLKGGETITPPRAVTLALRDVRAHEGALKKCLTGVLLYQHEFDAFMSTELNTGAVCASSIPGKLRAGNYTAACGAILSFNKFCTAKKVNGKCPAGALKELPGLTERRKREYKTCMGDA